MYLGDQENVVEATFDDIHSVGSVRITSIDEYSDGRYALRIPTAAQSNIRIRRLEIVRSRP